LGVSSCGFVLTPYFFFFLASYKEENFSGVRHRVVHVDHHVNTCHALRQNGESERLDFLQTYVSWVQSLRSKRLEHLGLLVSMDFIKQAGRYDPFQLL